MRIPVNSATQSDSFRPPGEAVGGRDATDAVVNGCPLFTSFSVIVEQSIVGLGDELFDRFLGGGLRAASRVAGEGDAVRVLQETIENGFGDGWITETLVPVTHRQL